MTAALIVPVMYANTGDYSWLSYAVGTIMLMFVAFNLNQFAKRSATSGSMFDYIARGLGPRVAAIGGWALIWSYLGIAMAGVMGFTVFAGKLLGMIGLNAPTIPLFAICVLAAWACAWKNVRLSALLMLVLEGLSMTLIIALCVIVLSHHHFAVDKVQFQLIKLPLGSLGLGVVVAIFSLVGFECATAFGDEAKDPLRAIPRAVTVSLVISGLFFMFVTYAMVQGVRGYGQPLSALDAPLNTLSTIYHAPALAAPLSLGAMVSFFALSLSCINAGARVIYAMGQGGVFPDRAALVHPANKTPHVAVTVMSALVFLVPTAMAVGRIAALDAFNELGTLAAFGFIVAYVLVTVAAPVYLKSLGALKATNIVMAAAALLLLGVPAVGSVWPAPPAPVLYFPYIFLVYMAIGVVWVMTQYGRKRGATDGVRKDLDYAQAGFRPVAGET
jgi:amino acid transporter